MLAANVDAVFVVQGLDEGPNPRRLERTLAAVHAGGAEPVIVLTKPDRSVSPLDVAASDQKGGAVSGSFVESMPSHSALSTVRSPWASSVTVQMVS